jgi:hypothetical protein
METRTFLSSLQGARGRRTHRRGVTRIRLVERLETRDLLAADLDSPCEPIPSLDAPPAFVAHPVYAPGTPMEIVEEHEHSLHVHDGAESSPFTVGGSALRWSSTASDGWNSTQGNPARLTWSIVPDGTPTIGDSGSASGKTSNLIARLDAIYGSASQPVLQNKVWFAHFQSVFNRWSELSGLEFVYEPNDDGVVQSNGNAGQVGVRGDIRIAGHNIDGNSGILAYNYYPDLGEMVIDTADNFYTITSANSLRLRNVVSHELGHGVGLGHVLPVDQTKLMEPYLTTSFDGPQFDDILEAHRRYGDQWEQGSGNDSVATATNLGSLSQGQSVAIGSDAVDSRVVMGDTDFISIDDDSDQDFFRFQVSGSSIASLTLWPLGPSYLSGPEGASTSLLDASALSDLSLTILDRDGTTVLAMANDGGLGAAEVLTNVALPAAGEYYIRVAGAQNTAQFYQLEVLLDSLTAVTTRIIDNGDTEFRTAGSWVAWGGQGYQGDIHEAMAGNGSQSATWTFVGLQPGLYQVAATWSAYSNRATNAPFGVYDGATLLAVERVNQQAAPSGLTTAGANWRVLGNQYAITGGTLVVRLTDDANGNLNADAIRIERIGDIIVAPEIQVLDGSTDLVDETANVSFGSTPTGTPVTRTFTVRNVGTESLLLTEPIQVPTGFVINSSFGSTTLASGASTTFSVRLTAATAGSYQGSISFGNNDSDENPFNFAIAGTVVTPPPTPVIRYIDNGDTGFSSVGVWTNWGGQGYRSDVHEALPGSGTGAASWTFTDLPPGLYEVAATWTSYSNRATNSPFLVLDGSSQLATYRINQRIAPSGFSADGVTWQVLGGSHSISGSTLVVRLHDDANGRLNADGIRIQRVGDLVNAPEIQVLDGMTDLADGFGSVSFGSTPPGTPVTRTFTVRNVGTLPLTLTEPITVPAGFTLVTSFANATLAAGESTTFQVRLTAATEGNFSGEVSFANNDTNESPFNFAVEGTVAATPPPPVIAILDNGDTGFATVGSWSPWGGQGYQGDVHEAMPGTGSSVASWTFTDLQPGRYEVAATWTTYDNRATNAPFAISDGANVLTTVRVNQRVAPSGFNAVGTSWLRLGTTHSITGTSLTVRLSNDANGRLNADAIRIERVGELANAPEIQVLDGTTDIVDGSGSVSFGTTPPGTPVSRTFTVRNVGTQELTLGSSIQVPSGFTVSTPLGMTTLAAGASTTFGLQLTAASLGTFSGAVSFTNSDADENPFNFTVTGTVASTPPEPVLRIIDDGDADFRVTGGWTRWGGQGYQGDIREALSGASTTFATWTFEGLPAGTYAVAATWSAFSNRATDAPFTVLDGATSLATVRLNQRLVPDDFSSSDNTTWERLGSYTISSGTLVVSLGANANGRLNADAIRIERMVSGVQYASAANSLAPPRSLAQTAWPVSAETGVASTPPTTSRLRPPAPAAVVRLEPTVSRKSPLPSAPRLQTDRVSVETRWAAFAETTDWSARFSPRARS